MNTPADDDRLDAIARGAFAGPPEAPGDAPDEDGAFSEGVDIAELVAYRAGELSPAAAERIEAALAADPEARALLRALADPVPPFLVAWGGREARKALGAGGRRWIAPAAITALAAAVALFVLVPRGPAAPDYHIGAVRGVQADVRGEAEAALGGRVDPDSVLVVALAPADARDTPPPARAFVEAPDGRLGVVAPATIVAGEGGALRFEAPVGELFGRGPEAFGERTLWIALGADDGRLAALDGRAVEAARGAVDGVRWLAVRVDYREAPK